ncbi:sugar phosphate isomerase/epimerase [PVC group bacterium]|nr:sugar phosphate isomerase/epimerase [PVC group bacterium]
MISPQIGVCSWSLRPSDPKALALDLQNCGVDAVQLAIGPVSENPVWECCQSILSDSEVKILSGMFAPVGEDYSTLATIAITGGVRQDATWSETLESAKRTAVIASDMELTLVTFHAGFLPHDASSERTKMLDRLRQIADIFEAFAIKTAFETGQETATVLSEVLDELAHPNVGVNFDPANIILYGKGDPVEAITVLEPWVRQVHIKDAVATKVSGTWGTEVVVGTGDVDWKSFLAAVPEGVDLIIERETGDDRVGDIQKAITFLEKQGC